MSRLASLVLLSLVTALLVIPQQAAQAARQVSGPSGDPALAQRAGSAGSASGTATGTYPADGGSIGTASVALRLKVRFNKQKRARIAWKVDSGPDVEIKDLQVETKPRKNKDPEGFFLIFGEKLRGKNRGVLHLESFGEHTQKSARRLQRKPGTWRIRAQVHPDDYDPPDIRYTTQITGPLGGGSGGGTPLKAERVRQKQTRAPASARFGTLRAILKPKGKANLDRILTSLTDRETEVLEGQSLVCWLAGGGLEGRLVAQSRLTDEAVADINITMSVIEVYGVEKYTPCQVLVIGTLLYLDKLKASERQVGATTPRRRGRSCDTAPIGLIIDPETHRVRIPDYLPGIWLDVSCGLQKKGRKLTVKADAFYADDSIRTALQSSTVRITAADQRSPKKKPQVEVDVRQSGDVDPS